MYFYDFRPPNNPRATKHGLTERHPTRLAFCLTTGQIIEHVKQFDTALPEEHALKCVGESDHFFVFRLQSGFNTPQAWEAKLNRRTERLFKRALKAYDLTIDLIKDAHKKERLSSFVREPKLTIALRHAGQTIKPIQARHALFKKRALLTYYVE